MRKSLCNAATAVLFLAFAESAWAGDSRGKNSGSRLYYSTYNRYPSISSYYPHGSLSTTDYRLRNSYDLHLPSTSIYYHSTPSYVNDYRFKRGLDYLGAYHSWAYSRWFSAYNCYCYYCSTSRLWYYWDPVRCCYYPVILAK